ncbi:MAG: universal stress protein [Pseudomonadota bacterium]
MASIRLILYAVRNPEARTLPGITKAASLAKSLGASLELFHALSSPVFLELQPMMGKTIAQLEAEALARNRNHLEKFAASARSSGINVKCSVAPGNTAERILDDLQCDVLIVKPEHFSKRVRAKSRGMRVVSLPIALVSA